MIGLVCITNSPSWTCLRPSSFFFLLSHTKFTCYSKSLSLGVRVPGFWWEHVEYIAGIETLCPAFAQQEHPVHIWNVIWLCVPNVPIGNISFTAGMRPCHVSEMYPPRTFRVLSVHVCKMSRLVPFGHVFGPLLSPFRSKFTRYSSHSARKQQKHHINKISPWY